MPDLAVDIFAPDPIEDGFTFVPLVDSHGGFGAVVDRQGRWVWAWEIENTPMQLVPSQDGRAVPYNSSAIEAQDWGGVVRVSYDGTVEEKVGMAGAHTDFCELDDGGYAILVWEVRELEGRKFLGDTLMEVRDGEEPRAVWSTFDDIEVDLSVQWSTDWAGAGPGVEDWSHANGVTYDAVTRTFYVSLGGLDAIAAVNRDTGELQWLLGNDSGDFASKVPQLVQDPHSVELVAPTSILVFNRGVIEEVSNCSSAVEIRFDQSAGVAEPTWSYASDDCMNVTYLGSASRMADGNTLVSWSTAGRMEIAGQDGSTLWRLQSPLGAGFGFGHDVMDLY